MAASRRLRLAAELALAALLVSLAAYGVSAALRAVSWTLPPAESSATDAAAPRRPEALDAYAVIAARDLFNPGTSRDGQLAQELRLWGVGLHGGQAHAVIEDTATRRQELYHLGDEVRGARITAITWDQVSLSRGGAEETLELAVRAPDGAEAAASAAAPAAVDAPSPSIRRTGADAWIVDRRELAGSVDNMSGLMTQLRAVAEVHDGRPAGFRLFQIKDDSIFHRLGLEDGDVVQRINGNAVGEPATLLAFLQRLRSEPRVAVDIVRGGAPRTLVYDLR